VDNGLKRRNLDLYGDVHILRLPRAQLERHERRAHLNSEVGEQKEAAA